MGQEDRPSDGDVLITTETGRHFLSVIPHQHRLSFSKLPAAMDIARKWAAAQNVSVWLTANGRTERVPPEES